MEQNNKTDKLLEVRDLQVSFFTPAGEVKAVNGISYDLDYNEVMGVVRGIRIRKECGSIFYHWIVTKSGKSNRWLYYI